jgi:hypothetical protein
MQLAEQALRMTLRAFLVVNHSPQAYRRGQGISTKSGGSQFKSAAEENVSVPPRRLKQQGWYF